MIFLLLSLFSFSALAADEKAVQAKPNLTIHMLGQVEVKDDLLLLRDIVTCVGDPSLCTEVESFDLGPIPMIGQRKTITRFAIEKAIQKEWPHITFSWSGPSYVVISTHSESIETEAVAKIVYDFMDRQNQKNKNVKLSIKRLYLPTMPKVRSAKECRFGDLAFNLQDWLEKASPLKLEIPYQCTEQEKSVLIITMDIRREYYRLVAKYDIEKGQIVSARDFVYSYISQDTPEFDVQTINGLAAQMRILKGGIIQSHAFKKPLVLKRNSSVQVRMALSSGDIVTMGVVLEDGYLNQMVTVKLLGTKKIISGRIKHAGLVEVE